MKRALICGVGGQDGSYLAKFLLGKGYEVHGSSRDAQASAFANLDALGILGDISLVSIAGNDFRSVLQALTRIRPDEIYNLAGQSSVGLSFDQPVETMESVSIATLNLLEAIRFSGEPIRFYNAGSGECFGDSGDIPSDELTPFKPRSPYAVAKAAAYWEVANYREAYDLLACTGILFNHESPLRPQRFVTRKIIAAACRIAGGSEEKLPLGNISISRDWGWAPEYVEAMWLMLQQDHAQDFVIATGESHTLAEFVDGVFAELRMDWKDHVTIEPGLFRPSDIAKSLANPRKAREQLGWQASIGMDELIRRMIAAEQART